MQSWTVRWVIPAESMFVYLGIFELGVSVLKWQAIQSEIIVYAEVGPLDGFGLISRRGTGWSGEEFFVFE